jgi:serine/threonine protein kinase
MGQQVASMSASSSTLGPAIIRVTQNPRISVLSRDYHPAARLTEQAKTKWRAAQKKSVSREEERAQKTAWPIPVCEDFPVESLVMKEPRVPAKKAKCFSCGASVNPEKKFCGSCGSPNDFSPSLKTGDFVSGQYSIMGPVAYGGMGWIYLAHDTKLNRPVVLKGVLNSDDNAAHTAALIERDMLALVRHPLIVAIENHVEHNGASYIVMEYVPGKTLRQIRKEKGPLPIHEALGTLISIAPALSALHEKGLAYCDLKPDNIMVMPNGGLKLIDLGAVRRIGDVSEDIYGTEGFLPKDEVGRIPSIALDIYTMGRTLAVLISDFDNTGEYVTSLPPQYLLNRILTEEELSLRFGRPVGEDISFTLRGGSLPPWLQVTKMEDRNKSKVHVLHGFAPEGFTSLDIEAVSGESTVTVNLSTPLADPFIRALINRATHHDVEGRFSTMEEFAEEMGALIRLRIGHAGFPARRRSSFLPATNPLSSRPRDWLPNFMGNATAEERVDIERAMQNLDIQSRISELKTLVNRPKKFGNSPEAHLRLIESLSHHEPAQEMEVRRLIEQAVVLNPWDWRAAWSEGAWLVQRGLYAEAVNCFQIVFEALPCEAAPNFALGICHAMMGHDETALIWFDTALALDPSLFQVQPVRHFVLCRLGRLSWQNTLDNLDRHPIAEQVKHWMLQVCLDETRNVSPENIGVAERLLTNADTYGVADTSKIIRALKRLNVEAANTMTEKLMKKPTDEPNQGGLKTKIWKLMGFKKG